VLFVRELRVKCTEAEKLLWQKLRAKRLGVKFRRQVDIGPFVVDFCCFPKKLIVELDGQIHKNALRRKSDLDRTKYLEKLGYRVVRFWNDEVVNEIEVVLERIGGCLTSHSNGPPSPEYRRGEIEKNYSGSGAFSFSTLTRPTSISQPAFWPLKVSPQTVTWWPSNSSRSMTELVR